MAAAQYTVLSVRCCADSLKTAMIRRCWAKGVRLKPRTVDATDADGTEQHKRAVEPGERMVSEQTAASCLTLRECGGEQAPAPGPGGR